MGCLTCNNSNAFGNCNCSDPILAAITGTTGATGAAGAMGANGASVIYQSWLDNLGTAPWLNTSATGNGVAWGVRMTDDGVTGSNEIKYNIPAGSLGLIKNGSFYEITTEFRLNLVAGNNTTAESIGLRIFNLSADLIKFTKADWHQDLMQRVRIVTRLFRYSDTTAVTTSTVYVGYDADQLLFPVQIYNYANLTPFAMTWVAGGDVIIPTCETSAKILGEIACDYMTIVKYLM